MASHDSGRVVIAALVGNVLVAATKTAAALVTGSSAMMSEAVHTAADTGNELVLLYGAAEPGARRRGVDRHWSLAGPDRARPGARDQGTPDRRAGVVRAGLVDLPQS